MKKNLLALLSLTICMSLAAHSQLITLSVDASKQGKFKGESTRSKFMDRSELAGYLSEVTTPREMGGGMATGKRNYQPIILLKQSGASSPQFFQAAVTNELLKAVVIDFYKTDASGMEINYYSVTLQDATISGYKQFIGPLENEKFNPANNILYDEIKLSFQKIIVEDKIAKTMSMDDLRGQK